MNDKWLCREIMHAGEGPPGPTRTIHYVSPVHSSRDAAEAFVAELVDKECRENGWDEEDYGHFDGGEYVIEAKADGAETWDRYRVLVRVKLEFEAREEAGVKS